MNSNYFSNTKENENNNAKKIDHLKRLSLHLKSSNQNHTLKTYQNNVNNNKTYFKIHEYNNNEYLERVNEMDSFMSSSRFMYTKRIHNAENVIQLQGSFPLYFPSSYLSMKLYTLLRSLYEKKSYSHTFGIMDPVQLIQSSEYLNTIYVSGWQSSSTASTSNDPGPDLADYPMDTVPNKVDQLFRAQLFHDRKQYEELQRNNFNKKKIDYFIPIIADADTGHGGITAIMKLTKMFIENGAAGIHIEDQKAGTKKCGHLSGKVLVSINEHVKRLQAIRLQADILNSPLIIIARTDAESAKYLDNNIDNLDHQFILGVTNKNLEPFSNDVNIEEWEKSANLKTYPQAIIDALNSSKKTNIENLINVWSIKYPTMSLNEMIEFTKTIFNIEIYFDIEKARTSEGYYRIDSGVDYSILRALQYAPYADLLWMETSIPDLSAAKKFSMAIKSKYPHQMLGYNLSPSFNWDATNMDNNDILEFCDKLGDLGYCYQFITVGGLHCTSLSISKFAKDYSERKMLAYVDKIQRKERELNVSTLYHQKWSGAELIDKLQNTILGDKSSTSIMGKETTESQF